MIGLLGENFHSAVIRMAVQIERMAMILTAMRGDSSLTTRAQDKGKDRPLGSRSAWLPASLPFSDCQVKAILQVDASSAELMSESHSDAIDKIWQCSDEDYETAEMIGNKMLLHMAAAYRMIDGDKQDVVPEIKPIDQRKVLFEQLKGTFERKELIKEAKAQGISERTAERWNDKWQEQGQVIKLEHGRYKKVG